MELNLNPDFIYYGDLDVIQHKFTCSDQDIIDFDVYGKFIGVVQSHVVKIYNLDESVLYKKFVIEEELWCCRFLNNRLYCITKNCSIIQIDFLNISNSVTIYDLLSSIYYKQLTAVPVKQNLIGRTIESKFTIPEKPIFLVNYNTSQIIYAFLLKGKQILMMIDSLQRVQCFNNFTQPITCISFTEEPDIVAAGTLGGVVQLIDMRKSSLLTLCQSSKSSVQMIYQEKNYFVITHSNGAVYIYDIINKQLNLKYWKIRPSEDNKVQEKEINQQSQFQPQNATNLLLTNQQPSYGIRVGENPLKERLFSEENAGGLADSDDEGATAEQLARKRPAIEQLFSPAGGRLGGTLITLFSNAVLSITEIQSEKPEGFNAVEIPLMPINEVQIEIEKLNQTPVSNEIQIQEEMSPQQIELGMIDEIVEKKQEDTKNDQDSLILSPEYQVNNQNLQEVSPEQKQTLESFKPLELSPDQKKEKQNISDLQMFQKEQMGLKQLIDLYGKRRKAFIRKLQTQSGRLFALLDGHLLQLPVSLHYNLVSYDQESLFDRQKQLLELLDYLEIYQFPHVDNIIGIYEQEEEKNSDEQITEQQRPKTRGQDYADEISGFLDIQKQKEADITEQENQKEKLLNQMVRKGQDQILHNNSFEFDTLQDPLLRQSEKPLISIKTSKSMDYSHKNQQEISKADLNTDDLNDSSKQYVRTGDFRISRNDKSPKSQPLSGNINRIKFKQDINDLQLEELLYEDDEVFRQVLQEKIQRISKQSDSSEFDIRNLQALTFVQYQLPANKIDPHQYESKQQARARQNKEAIETLQNFYQQFLGISMSDLTEDQQYYQNLDNAVAQGISQYNGEQQITASGAQYSLRQSMRSQFQSRNRAQVTRRMWNPRTKDAEQIDLDFDNYPPLRILGGLAAQKTYKIKQRMTAKLLQMYTATKFSGPEAFELIKQMFIKKLKDDEERARRKEEEERIRILEWKKRKKELVMKYYESEDDSPSEQPLDNTQDLMQVESQQYQNDTNTVSQPKSTKSDRKLNQQLIKPKKTDEEHHIYKYGSSTSKVNSQKSTRDHVKKVNVSGLAARILDVQDDREIFQEREMSYDTSGRLSRGSSQQISLRNKSGRTESRISQCDKTQRSRQQSRATTAKNGDKSYYNELSTEEEEYEEDPKFALAQRRNQDGPRRGRGEDQISRPPSTTMKGGKISRKKSGKSHKSSRYADNFNDKDSEYTVSYVVMDQHASRRGSDDIERRFSYISEEEDENQTGVSNYSKKYYKDQNGVVRSGTKAYRKNSGQKKKYSSKKSHSQALNTSPTEQFSKKGIRKPNNNTKENMSIDMSQSEDYYSDELTSITSDFDDQMMQDGHKKYVKQKGESYKHNKVIEAGDRHKAKEINRALKILASRKFFSADNIDQALNELMDVTETKDIEKQIKLIQKSLLRIPQCQDYYLIRNFKCIKGRQPSLSAYQMAALFILFCFINKEKVPIKSLLQSLTKAQFSNDEVFEISKEIRRIQADYQGNNQLEIPEKEKRLQDVSQWRNDKISPDDLNQLDLSQNSSFSFQSNYSRREEREVRRKHKKQQNKGQNRTETLSSDIDDITQSTEKQNRDSVITGDESSTYQASTRTTMTQSQQQGLKSSRVDKNKSKLNQLSGLMQQQEKQNAKKRKEEERLRRKQEKQRLLEEQERERVEEQLRLQKLQEEEEAERELQAALEAERERQAELQRQAEEEARNRVVLSEKDLLGLQLAQYFDPIALRYEKNKLTKAYAPNIPANIFRSKSIQNDVTPENKRGDTFIYIQKYQPDIPAFYDLFKKNFIQFLKIFNIDYEIVKQKYQPSEEFNFDGVYQRLTRIARNASIPIFENQINMAKFKTFYTENIEHVFVFDSIKLKHFSKLEKQNPERSISLPQMIYDYSYVQEDLNGSQSSIKRPASRDRKTQRPSFAAAQQQKQAEIIRENMKKLYKQKAPIIQQLQLTNIFEWTYQPFVTQSINDDQNKQYVKNVKQQNIEKAETSNKKYMPLKTSVYKYVTSLDDYKIITDSIRLRPSGRRKRSVSVDFTIINSLSNRMSRKMLLQTYNDSFQFNNYKVENQANKTLQQIQNEVITMNTKKDEFDDSIINQKYIVNEDEKTYQIITAQQFGGSKNGLQTNSGFYITNEEQIIPSLYLFDDQWLFGGFETFRSYGAEKRYGIISQPQISLEAAIQGLNENSLKNFKELPQPLITPPPSFDEKSVHKDLVFSTPYDLENNTRKEQLKIDRYIARQERLFQRRAAIGKVEESKLYLEKKKRIEMMIEARKKLQKSFLEFPNELLQIILVQDSADWIVSKCENIFQLPKQLTSNGKPIFNDINAKKFLKVAATQPAFNIQPIAVMNMHRYFSNTQISLIGNIKYIIKFQSDKIFYEKLEKLKEYTFDFEQSIADTYQTAANIFFHFFQQPSMEKLMALSENEENWEAILFKQLSAAQELKKRQLEEEIRQQEEIKEQERRKNEEKIANETQDIINGFINGGDQRKLTQIMLLNKKNDFNITKVDINKQIQLNEKDYVYKFYHKLNDFTFSTLVLKQQLIKQIGFKNLVVDWAIPFTTELDYGEMNEKKQRLFYGLAAKSLKGQSNCGIAQFCKGVESVKEFHRKNLLQGIIVKENTALPSEPDEKQSSQQNVNNLGLSPVQQAIAKEKERLLKLQYKAEIDDIISRPMGPSKTLLKSLKINDGENVLQYTINRNKMVETGDLEESSQFESEYNPQNNKSSSKNTNNSYKFKLSEQQSDNSNHQVQNESSEFSFNIVQLGSNKSRTSSNISELMKPIIRAPSPMMKRNLIKSGQSTRVQIELKRIQSRGAARRSPTLREAITMDDLKTQVSPNQSTIPPNAQPLISPEQQKPKYNNAISVMEANKKPMRSPTSHDDEEEIKLRVVSKQLSRARVIQ